jgi:hypothetical protein
MMGVKYIVFHVEGGTEVEGLRESAAEEDI